MLLKLIEILLYVSVFKDYTAKSTGGQVVRDPRRFPSQVSLRYNGNHFCGGIIYKQDVVLTAAHCIKFLESIWNSERSSIRVVAGEVRLSGGNSQNFGVRSVKLHPYFVNSSLSHNIAIIQIDGSFTLSDRVKPVSLIDTVPEATTDCTVSGWGSRFENLLANYTDELRVGSVTLTTTEACKYLLINGNYRYTGAEICTWPTRETDPFMGDSGGPLLCKGLLTGVTTGIVRTDNVEAYSSIPFYRSWLDGGKASAGSTGSLHRPLCILLLLSCSWLILIYFLLKQ